MYYKELMHQKAQNRALQRKSSKAGESIKLGSVYKTRPKRKPRSMLEIRESLRVMMENELIEIENKKMQKKLKAKQTTEPNTGRTSQTRPTPRSLGSQDLHVTKMPDENRAVKNSKPSLSHVANVSLRKRKNGIVCHITNGTGSETDMLEQPPVLVTELSKEIQDNEQNLPAIREEKTQEEIILHKPNIVPTANSGYGVTDTQANIVRERSSDSSFKNEIPTKIEQPSEFKIHLNPEGQDAAHIITPKSLKRKSPMQKSISPKPNSISPKPKSISPKPKSISPKPKSISPKPKSTSPLLKLNTPQSDISQLKANVPKLPAINVEQITDEITDLNEGKSLNGADNKEDIIADNRTPNEERRISEHWQTPIKFVNERIQNRFVDFISS